MINCLSVAVHAFCMCIWTSFSVDETLPPRYMNWTTNFSRLPFNEEMAPFYLKYELSFIRVHDETNVSYCLIEAKQQRFGLSKCIFE